MKVELHKWEVERIKEIIGGILHFWEYDTIEVSAEYNRSSMSMSIKTFLENLERDLYC